MFRPARITYAPLASLKPVLAGSIKAQHSVNRLIGQRSMRPSQPSAINAVVEKTKGDGLAGTAACVARASVYLRSRNPTAAIEEVNAVLPKIQDETLKRHAIGVRLQALNELLDSKEAALNVSGGATEAEVSELRSKVKEDYTALKENSPGCWLVQLGDAEYSMYTGDNEGAHKQFVEIEKKIKDFIESPIRTSEEVATEENTHPFALHGFELRRYRHGAAKPQGVGAVAAEGMLNTTADPAAVKVMEQVKKTAGAQLTDEEAYEVAMVLYSASARHHYHDYFPHFSEEYDAWTSAGAEKAQATIEEAIHPPASTISSSALEKVRAQTPNKAFYDDEQKLRAFIKSAPKDKPIIESIRASFGKGPTTPLCSADQNVADALQSINSAVASHDMAGSPAFMKRQQELAKVLATQMLYRVQVQKGVALTEMNRMHEAVEAITPVIAANEYIYMWRALLARSRAYKGLGLITKSDKDVKALNKLKKSLSERAPYEKI